MDILSTLLSQQIKSTDKAADFERVLWLTKVMKWLQRPRIGEEKDSKKETVYTVRLKYILLMLKKNPQWKANFIAEFSQLLLKLASPSQLTSAGFTNSASFIQDFIHRLQEKILPNATLSEDLATLIYEIFPGDEESHYIDFIDASVLQDVFDLFKDEEKLHQKLKVDVLSAAYMLSVQILATSFYLRQELDEQVTAPHLMNEFLLEGLLRDYQTQQVTQVSREVLRLVILVEKYIHQLYFLMQERGVKIELVYLFQRQKRKLQRLKILIQFLDVNVSKAVNFRFFISHLVLETQHQKSLKSFFAENLSLITERIVQANSHIGEHYVTFNWVEFRKMFRSALGGGAVTGLTVFIKNAITELNLVGFMKGLIDSLNYSSSFLLIQFMGWTLATKQPSATAPFIASALKKSTTESRRSIIALLRTQFIAVLGNLSLAFPFCFIISGIFYEFGRPLHTPEYAMYTISSTNLLGPSALFAVFTGFLLFFGSLIAGFFENWVLINRLDKRIKYNESLRKYLGVARTLKLAEAIKINSNSLAANIALGFLLGMVPQLIKFMGIPIEVRHITLVTGGFAAALPVAIEAGLSYWEVLNAVSGILVIGLLNISVSFALAFLLASISSRVKFSSFWRLFKWGIQLIVTRPWLLLVPEKEKVAAEVTST
jgi:site-specific recombinase